jgi:DNA-binding PadR family transcriptional regulator
MNFFRGCRSEQRELFFGPRGFGRHRFGGGGPWQGETEDGRGGRRRVFDANELRLVLLKLIADQPRHGYDLIRAIEDLTGGSYAPSPGVVYPALSILQDLGQIEEVLSEGPRKAFSATTDGLAYLSANAEKVAELFARLSDLASVRERTDSAPIRRAMDNLRAVLKQRLTREDTDNNTLYEVAAILDSAAQRIERL